MIAVCLLAHCSLKPSDGARAPAPMFSIDSVQLASSQIVSSDTAHVEKLFNIKVCLRDEATLKPIVSESFDVRGGNATLNRTTNGEGCFFWPEQMVFNATAVPVYLTLNRELAATGSYQLSPPVPLPLALSPWREHDSLADLRFQKVEPLVPPAEVAAALEGNPTSVTPSPGSRTAGLTPGQPDPGASCQPRLDLTSASYTVGGTDYSVDNYLNLKVVRPIDLSIHPKLVRCQNLDQAVTVMDDLRAGLKLHAVLTFALGTSTQPHLMSRFSMDAFVNSRSELEFRVPLVTPFSNEIAVRNRVLMSVEITPLDPAAGSTVASGLAYVDGIGRLTSRILTFLQVPAPLVNASKQAQWRPSSWQSGSLEEPISALSTQPIDLVFPASRAPSGIHRLELKENDRSQSQAPSTPWTFAQLTAFLENRAVLTEDQRKQFLAPLCDQALTGQAEPLARCRANPSQFFGESIVELVEQIEAPPRFVPPLAPNPLIQVMAMFYTGISDNTNHTEGSSHADSNEHGHANTNGHDHQGGITDRDGYGASWEGGYKLLANGVSSNAFVNTEHYTGTRWVRTEEDVHSSYERRIDYDQVDNVEIQEHRSGYQALQMGALRAETVTLELALGLRVCLMVGPRGDAETVRGVAPYLICMPVPHQRRTERWYYLTDANSSLDMTAWQTAWVRTIRGDAALSAFRQAMQNNSLSYVVTDRPIDQSPAAGNPTEAFQFEEAWRVAFANSAFPGVLGVYGRPPDSPAPQALKWTTEQVRTNAQACGRQAVLHGASVTRAGLYCGCIYQSLAERCTYAEYQADTKKWDDLLKQDGTEGQCLSKARK
jgi:hypothetical protein